MRMVVRAAGPAAFAVLTACASGGPQIEMAQRAQTALVGLPKAELLSCAGVPNRQATVDGAEYLTYTARPDNAGGSPDVSLGAAMGEGIGLGQGIGVPLYSIRGTQGCDATFVLRGGVVQQLIYPQGANIEDCGAIVSNCMAR
ncbi:MAG TPA: hypothetical protein VD978_15750 [Azospirillum sp.]|nr:hypothetical protein [Azospirillum sp.]